MAKNQFRKASREGTTFRARDREFEFGNPRLIVGDLTLDRRVMRAATTVPFFHAASHSARVGCLSGDRDWRRDGGDQQNERRKESAQRCQSWLWDCGHQGTILLQLPPRKISDFRRDTARATPGLERVRYGLGPLDESRLMIASKETGFGVEPTGTSKHVPNGFAARGKHRLP